jgi:hydrogenase small subunit
MTSSPSWLERELGARGVSRRAFMEFCASMAAMFALPGCGVGRNIASADAIATALEDVEKPVLVWLEFQDCAGNTESFLRASQPSAAEVIIDLLSLDYHETLMAAAGHQAEAARAEAIAAHAGEYIAVVEGSIPTGAAGAFCTIGGRSALQVAEEVCRNAAGTIAIGTCASYGGLPAAAPNPTGALGVGAALPGLPHLIHLPACPANPENFTALIVHYLTEGAWPPLDELGRPVFAYGRTIQSLCERRPHFTARRYAQSFGDEGHRQGYCLYELGCKGPVTSHNCPNVRWNGGTSWPVAAGHPCIGCSEPGFWDQMTPFYQALSRRGGDGRDVLGSRAPSGRETLVQLRRNARATGGLA